MLVKINETRLINVGRTRPSWPSSYYITNSFVFSSFLPPHKSIKVNVFGSGLLHSVPPGT